MAETTDRRRRRDATRDPAHRGLLADWLDSLGQLRFPREFRIPLPVVVEARFPPEPAASSPPASREASDTGADSLLADLAVCLWDIDRKLAAGGEPPDDRRRRLAHRRTRKALDRLEEAGVSIDDPTGRRYVQGSEGFMKPIQFLPTDRVSGERVSETITPVVYRDERLLRRAEVFVAVPRSAGETAPSTPDDSRLATRGSPAGSSSDTTAGEVASFALEPAASPEPELQPRPETPPDQE